MLRWLIRILVLLTVAAGAVGAYGYHLLSQPYRAFDRAPMLQIPLGATSQQIAGQLQEAGVIRESWHFLAVRAIRPRAVLQAGEYQFMDAASVFDVFERIHAGDIYTFEVTIPEGSSIWDIARILEQQGMFTEAEFLAAASDPSPVSGLDPEAESLEGYLFPATYRISHATTARDLCRMMVEKFLREWRALGGAASPHDSAAAPHDVVTLASLVEKETGVPSERGEVAGVFANRLRLGMRLACDPTVLYAARLSGLERDTTIYRSDLDRAHPYNTYLNTGLPPGPIANPGAASIAAALHPASTQALYFVARPEGGGHVFSVTLAQHNRAVQNYRTARAHH